MARRTATYLALLLAVAAALAAAALLEHDSGGSALSLCPAHLAEAPYTLLTYVAVHGSALHATVNLAAIAAACCCALRMRCQGAAMASAALAVPAAGAVFCIAAALAGTPQATLSGASAPAFALAAFVCYAGAHRRLTLLIAALALAGIFGPNAGGAAAHCTAVAAGAGGAAIHLHMAGRRLLARRRFLKSLHDKVQTSGYASLSAEERRALSSSKFIL